MDTTIYPASDLDRNEVLLALLGSFWQNTYDGKFVVETLLSGVALEENQSLSAFQEAIDALSRQLVPVFHKDFWRPLVLLESQISNKYLRYGDGAVYGNDYQYGVAIPLQTFEFPLSEDIAYVPRIANGIAKPTRAFVHGIDYVIEPATLIFNANPFADPALADGIEDVYTDGLVTDRQMQLWLSGADVDLEHVHSHFGYVLKLNLPSSEAYRDLVNVIMDSLIDGAAGRKVERLIATVTGTPIVEHDGEVVEQVTADSRGVVIVTDRNAYRFSASATAIVSVGDVLYAGQQLTDVVVIEELNRGVVPADLYALAIGSGLLAADFSGHVGFTNATETLSATVVGGKTRVEFPLLGFPGDVEDFWDRTFSKGLENGATSLAAALDVREKPLPSETQPFHLPATINPLQFLLENVLRGGVTLVRVKADKILSPISSTELRWIRQISSPWTTMIVLFELEMPAESVIMDAPGESPGYEDTPLEVWDTNDAEGDEIDGSTDVTDDDPVLYIVDGYCL